MLNVDFSTVGAERLLKLADHLERGQLWHDQFDFRCVHIVEACGTRGCAMGELPAVFPDFWRFTDDDDAVGLIGSMDYFWPPMSQFFGITEFEAKHLFVPNYIGNKWNKGNVPHKALGLNASRFDVAKSIRQFVVWKYNQLPGIKAVLKDGTEVMILDGQFRLMVNKMIEEEEHELVGSR